MIMGIGRADLLDQAGVETPTTFEELLTVCEAIHRQEGAAAFVADKLHHWNWIPYLMGHGGGVFRDPPGDLMPVLDTPEAATAAEYYANLLDQLRPVRRAVLHRRPGHARPARRPCQYPDTGHRLDDPARQA